MQQPNFIVRPIGQVESVLTDRSSAPKQGREGAPSAWLVFNETIHEGLRELRKGDEVIVLTWLDRSDREVLRVHPRGDPANAEVGVFSTRSPDRPNPIGLHRVKIISVGEKGRLQVDHLEALHLTPIIDLKPVLEGIADQ